MEVELTPEQLLEMDKMWGEVFLKHMPVEERIAGLKPEELLATMKTAEILDGLNPEKIEELEKLLKKRKEEKQV